MDEMIKGEKLRCVDRKVSKTNLIVQTGRHTAAAEVVKTWGF